MEKYKYISFVLFFIICCCPFGISQTLTISGGFLVVENGTILSVPDDLMVEKGEVSLEGSLDVKGSINVSDSSSFEYGSNSDIILSSGGNQNLTGIDTIRTLTVNNNSVANLADDLVLENGIDFTAGKVVLGNFDLTLSAGANITGASSTNYIETSGSGRLIQQMANVSTLYPIGTNTSYLPLVVRNAGTIDDVAISVSEGVLSDGTSGVNITGRNVGHTWDISENTAGGSNLEITFQWNASDELTDFDRSTIQIYHYIGGEWVEEGAEGSALGSDPYTYTISGITTLSPFTAGDGNSTFPVEWLRFEAFERGGEIEIQWSTASEFNADYFGVEKSRDGENWAELGQVTATGFSDTQVDYHFFDTNPFQGKQYYRLRQVDVDGKVDYSQTIEMLFVRLGKVSVYPNPVVENMTIEWPTREPLTMQVFDNSGRFVQEFRKNEAFPSLSLGHLTTGAYILSIQTRSGISQKMKFIKQ